MVRALLGVLLLITGLHSLAYPPQQYLDTLRDAIVVEPYYIWSTGGKGFPPPEEFKNPVDAYKHELTWGGMFACGKGNASAFSFGGYPVNAGMQGFTFTWGGKDNVPICDQGHTYDETAPLVWYCPNASEGFIKIGWHCCPVK